MRTRIGLLLPAIACCLLFASQARATDYAYGYTSISEDGSVVRGYHRTSVDYNTDVYYKPYVCGSLYKDGVEVMRGCGGGFASATRNTQTPYLAVSSYSALSDHYVNIEYQEEDYYYHDVLGYAFLGGGSHPIDWYYAASGLYNFMPDQSIHLGNTTGALVRIGKIQYQNSTGLVDISGTLYVLKDTAVTFQAIPDPANATFPVNQPSWSGTSGATGTGATNSVTFNTISSSTTNFKTVVATLGMTSKTVNVIVYSLTGVLTPGNNFSGRSLVRFGVEEAVALSFTASPEVTASQAGGLRWSIGTTGGGLGTIDSMDDGTGNYVAPDTAKSIALNLKILAGPSKDQELVNAITIVEPSGGYITKNSGTRHTINTWSTGFLGVIHILPADVSFANRHFYEGTAPVVLSGWLNTNQFNIPHPQTSVANPIDSHNEVLYEDQIYTGLKGPAYGEGYWYWDIPWHVILASGRNINIGTFRQLATSDANGKAVISKGGRTVSSDAGDPSSAW